MRTLLGTGWRLVLFLVLLAAVVALPLISIQQSRCPGEGVSYSIVAPWDDPPAECRDHKTGLKLILEEIGID